MPEIRALIAAAGTGSRAGLPYPKTLHPVLGKPILIRLLELVEPVDARPTVIVSPAGRGQIAGCLSRFHRETNLVTQPRPTGMGDAILCFREAPAYDQAEHVLLAWGDTPLLQPDTIRALQDAHLRSGNDFTFVTRHVEDAYTVVERDARGRVRAVLETRELGIEPGPGERDIGLFLFRKEPVFALLEQRLEGAVGRRTGEHGFLYLVRHLVRTKHKVEALPIATELELVSLNSLSDLDGLTEVRDASRRLTP